MEMQSDYSSKDTPAELIASVRARPGMYIGSRDEVGLHNLIWEVVGNSIDEHLAGYGSAIRVSMDHETVCVSDHGRGIQLDDSLGSVGDAVDKVFGRVHDTATADGHHPHIHVRDDLVGAGLAVVCALSESLVLEVGHRDRRFRRTYSRGTPIGPPKELPSNGVTGTQLTFRPDQEIFGNARLDPSYVRERLHELGYLTPCVELFFNDELLATGIGVPTYCEQLARFGPREISKPFHVRGTTGAVDIDIAATWVAARRPPTVLSFVSQARTIEGGTHVDGFWEGLTKGLLSGCKDPVIRSWPVAKLQETVASGLVVVIHAGLYGPQWAGPTRDRLLNPEVAVAVADTVNRSFGDYVISSPRAQDALNRRFADWGVRAKF